MKILAATHQTYGRTIYIIELTSDDLVALTVFSPYRAIPVEGVEGGRAKDDLKAGDIIAPSHAAESMHKVEVVLNSKKKINEAGRSAVMEIEKLQDIITDTFEWEKPLTAETTP